MFQNRFGYGQMQSDATSYWGYNPYLTNPTSGFPVNPAQQQIPYNYGLNNAGPYGGIPQTYPQVNAVPLNNPHMPGFFSGIPFTTPYQTSYVNPMTTPFQASYVNPMTTPFQANFVNPMTTPFQANFVNPMTTPFQANFVNPMTTGQWTSPTCFHGTWR